MVFIFIFKFLGTDKKNIIVIIWTHPTITKAIVNLVKSSINNEKEVIFRLLTNFLKSICSTNFLKFICFSIL